MNTNTSRKALVCIDFINEIVDPKGKLAAKGYASFDQKHRTLDAVQSFILSARDKQFAIIHVRIGFSSDYKEHPENSPLFRGAKAAGALRLGSWGTEFHQKAEPIEGEAIITKHRVSAFFSTPLDLLLKQYAVHELFICGVATDLAVQASVQEAHDRDYAVAVVADCCVAANDEDHARALKTLAKIAKVVSCEEVFV